jgi:hypothetical protein
MAVRIGCSPWPSTLKQHDRRGASEATLDDPLRLPTHDERKTCLRDRKTVGSTQLAVVG